MSMRTEQTARDSWPGVIVALILSTVTGVMANAPLVTWAMDEGGSQERFVETKTTSSGSEPASLLLQGYNYTDHYIDSFSVNGQGGGNVFESSPQSGGGKSVCCVSWWPRTQLPTHIEVRWTAAYCTFREKNPYSFGNMRSVVPSGKYRRFLSRRQSQQTRGRWKCTSIATVTSRPP